MLFLGGHSPSGFVSWEASPSGFVSWEATRWLCLLDKEARHRITEQKAEGDLGRAIPQVLNLGRPRPQWLCVLGGQPQWLCILGDHKVALFVERGGQK